MPALFDIVTGTLSLLLAATLIVVLLKKHRMSVGAGLLAFSYALLAFTQLFRSVVLWRHLYDVVTWAAIVVLFTEFLSGRGRRRRDQNEQQVD